ncbi:MAG: hypothetical protein JO244_11875 [Solirubrobacterales bacterium]|nr:hypothetical protein [Solirubrobacterales bacterium]
MDSTNVLTKRGGPGRGAIVTSWLREWATTTPGRLALIGILVIIGAVAFGAIATVAEHSRAQAAQAVRAQTEPLLLDAATLDTSLSDASATVTSTFLQGGVEPPARRAQYLRDLRVASGSLTELTRGVSGSPAATQAVAAIATQLPVYTGLIEDARANNRQGLPVGSAYLRAASAVLTGSILAEADRLYTLEAGRLNSDYGTGTSTPALAILIVTAVLALALLIVAQRSLSRISRRTLNVLVVLGTVVLAAASIWAIVGLTSEQSSLQAAQRDSDAVEVLTASRVLLSRAQTDQSLTLVNRGSDETDPLDFAAVMRALTPPQGLLRDAAAARARAGLGGAGRVDSEFTAYSTQTGKIAQLESAGRIGGAIAFASSAQAAGVAEAPNTTLVDQTTAAQQRFATNAANATGALSGLTVALPILTALAAALVLLGLRQRLEEYR